MSETSKLQETIQLDWYNELKDRICWLVRSEDSIVDREVRRIKAEDWEAWLEVAQKAEKHIQTDGAFETSDLQGMIRAFERLAKPPCEGIDIDETAKTVQFLFDLTRQDGSLQINKTTGEQRQFSLSWSSVSLSPKSLSLLITLVVYIRSTNNLELLKSQSDFAEKFNTLVSKLDSLPTSKSAESLDTSKRKSVSGSSKKQRNKPSPTEAYKQNSGLTQRQPDYSTGLNKEVPVSLILVFSIKHISSLHAFAANPEAYTHCADLLKQYEWAWFGRKDEAHKNYPNRDPNSVNHNLCWLQLNIKACLDPRTRPSRLKITDWIDMIQKDPNFISDALADNEGFDLETSRMKDKGFFVK